MRPRMHPHTRVVLLAGSPFGSELCTQAGQGRQRVALMACTHRRVHRVGGAIVVTAAAVYRATGAAALLREVGERGRWVLAVVGTVVCRRSGQASNGQEGKGWERVGSMDGRELARERIADAAVLHDRPARKLQD